MEWLLGGIGIGFCTHCALSLLGYGIYKALRFLDNIK